MKTINPIVRKFITLLIIAIVVITGLQSNYKASAADPVTLTIESWRTGDEKLWDQVIAAFEAKNPDIKVKFQPTNPPDYNAALNAKLQSGTAGDLITCRPFDAGALLYKDGHLADLSKLPGLEHFGAFAQSAWTTEEGVVYCVPMASVLHGFIYNKDYFDEHGFKEPATYEEFLTLLEAIKAEGSMAPLALGTKEGWTVTSMGSDNIGPNFWGGDPGRLGLLDGSRKINDAQFVSAFDAFSKWTPFLPQGHEAITYTDSQGLFTSGKAAIFPAGSWEISGFNADADFAMGAFKAPPPADLKGDCWISDQIDIALGANAKSAHLEESKKFLEFLTTEDFATMYSKGLPGFFSLSDYKITLDDPLANTFLSWRQQCKSALRVTYQKLQGNPDLSLENELWNLNTQLLQGKVTPQQMADQLQSNIDKYYPPAGAAAAATAAK
jgi:raffinose/stachyose/melibiose transport system substrate-binding protein